MGSNFSKQTQSKTCSMPKCTCTVCVHCKHTEHTENVSSFRINMVRRSSRSRSRGREVNYIIYYYNKLRDHLYKTVIHGPKLESGLRVLKRAIDILLANNLISWKKSYQKYSTNIRRRMVDKNFSFLSTSRTKLGK